MFIDKNSSVDKEALRTYSQTQLKQLKERAEHLITGEQFHAFWEELHNYIVTTQTDATKETFLSIEGQLKNLPVFIEKWIETSVESSERFEFFISTKAEEIQTGDTPHDYFWALQIRHDQLVALVHVLTKLLEHLKRWVRLSAQEVVDDGVFQGMLQYTIEQQVYLEAQNIHNQRNEMMKKS